MLLLDVLPFYLNVVYYIIYCRAWRTRTYPDLASNPKLLSCCPCRCPNIARFNFKLCALEVLSVVPVVVPGLSIYFFILFFLFF
jgi:hypothetical protein